MRTLRSAVAAACLATLAALPARPLAAQVLDPIQSRLVAGSEFEYGCFGPCACPVFLAGALDGSFTLYRTSVDPLFEHYALLNILWKYTTGAPGSERTVHVTGHGTFDIGGEVALEQRMQLDLVFQDPTLPVLEQSFDSGFVPVRATFPAMDVDVYSHLGGCVDSLLHVIASPGGVLATDPFAPRVLLGSPLPNPSAANVDILFAPAVAGHAIVQVFDITGRAVATLLDGDLPAGQYPLRWNGRDDRGTLVAAGVYWVSARSGGASERRSLVRVR